ncbi:hypothetical protein [Halorarum salinum]|uniref:Uncharacterized protein n=1 Tax=Halorarum salinum TaxID=2743089 RepID=A0A7D5QH39_9EURY|nr:hypothetical protein [Halobaculum salinum]QLG61964.1 hypothetical protein HUG12_09625 [Halobaculum salinum]
MVFSNDEKKERIPLDDRIWGIEGMYHGKREAKGHDGDEPVYYVQYKPDVEFSSWLKYWLAVLWPFSSIEDGLCETPEPIPESMIQDQKTPPTEAEGVPKFKKVLLRDKNGNQPYQARLEEELGKDLKAVSQQKHEKEGDRRRQAAKRHKERRRNSGESSGSASTAGGESW